MAKLGLKKLLIALITTVLLFASGLTLAVSLNKQKEKSAQQTAPGNSVQAAGTAYRLVDLDSLGYSYSGDSNHYGYGYSYEELSKCYEDTNDFAIGTVGELKFFRDWVNGFSYDLINKDGSKGVCTGVNDIPSSGSKSNSFMFFDKNGNRMDFSGKNIYLLNDLDLKNIPWVPIGCYAENSENKNDHAFAGFNLFDGLGHTISNVNIDCNKMSLSKLGNDDSYTALGMGFFGIVGNEGTVVTSVTIKNLKINNIMLHNDQKNATSYTSSKPAYFGLLIGAVFNSSITVENCSILNGTLYRDACLGSLGLGLEEFRCTAGLIAFVGRGVTYCSIKNCSIDADIYGGWAWGAYGSTSSGCYAGVLCLPSDDTISNRTVKMENIVFRGIVSTMVASKDTSGNNHPNSDATELCWSTNRDSPIDKGTAVNCYFIGRVTVHDSTGTSDDGNITNRKIFDVEDRVPDTYFYHQGSESNRITEDNFASKSPDQRMQFFGFSQKYNDKTSSIRPTSLFMYVPRTDEFNNGLPISTELLAHYQDTSDIFSNNRTNRFINLNFKIEGKGTVVIGSDSMTSSGPGRTMLPYEAFTGSNYYDTADFKNDFAGTNTGNSNPEKATAKLYGYDVTITPATYYTIQSVKLTPAGVGTLDKPYTLEVTFTRKPVDVSVNFAGFYDQENKKVYKNDSGMSWLQVGASSSLSSLVTAKPYFGSDITIKKSSSGYNYLEMGNEVEVSGKKQYNTISINITPTAGFYQNELKFTVNGELANNFDVDRDLLTKYTIENLNTNSLMIYLYCKLDTGNVEIKTESVSGKKWNDYQVGLITYNNEIVEQPYKVDYIKTKTTTYTYSQTSDSAGSYFSITQPSWVSSFTSLKNAFPAYKFYLNVKQSSNYIMPNYGYSYSGVTRSADTITVKFAVVKYNFYMWLDDPTLEGIGSADEPEKVLEKTYTIESEFLFENASSEEYTLNEAFPPSYWGVITSSEYWEQLGFAETELNADKTLLTVSNGGDVSVKFLLEKNSEISNFGYEFCRVNRIDLKSWGNLPDADEIKAKMEDNELIPYLFPYFEMADVQLKSGSYAFNKKDGSEVSTCYGEQYLVEYGGESNTYSGLNADDTLWQKTYVKEMEANMVDGAISFLTSENGGTLVKIYFKVLNPNSESEADKYLSSADGWGPLLKFYDVTIYMGDETYELRYSNIDATYNTGEPFEMVLDVYEIKFVAKLKQADFELVASAAETEEGYNIANFELKNSLQNLENLKILMGSTINTSLYQNGSSYASDYYFYYIVTVKAPKTLLTIFEGVPSADIQNEYNQVSYNIFVYNYDSCKTQAENPEFVEIHINSNHGYMLMDNPLSYSINNQNSEGEKLVYDREVVVMPPAQKKATPEVSSIAATIPDAPINILYFKVACYLDEYSLYLHYMEPSEAETTTTYSSITKKYDVFDEFRLEETVASKNTNYAFSNWILTTDIKAWLVNASAVKFEGNGSTVEVYSTDSSSTIANNQAAVNKIFEGLKVNIVLTYNIFSTSTGELLATTTKSFNFDLNQKINTVAGFIDGYAFYTVAKVHDSYGTYAGSSTNPYLRATWGKPYDVVIENDVNKIVPSPVHYYQQDGVSREDYFGVYASWGNDDTKIKMTVVNNNVYNYPFFTNNLNNFHTAFYKKSDYDINQGSAEYYSAGSKWWFVYNYGYEVSAWLITFEYGGRQYCITLDANNKWVYSTSTEAVPVEKLNKNSETDTRMFGFIEMLKSWTADSSLSPVITFTPVWQASTIVATALKYNYTTLSSRDITYGENYSLKTFTDVPKGKSLVYYQKDSTVIANVENNSLKWNYRSLRYNNYEYRSNKYYIDLEPVFLDNVYKVELRVSKLYESDPDGRARLVMDSSDYSFADQALNNAFGLSVYTFDNNSLYVSEDGFKFTSIEQFKNSVSTPMVWTEDYSKILSTFRDNYQLSITGRSVGTNDYLTILRKVYVKPYAKADNYTFVNDGQQYPAAIVNSSSSVYVYFANEQNVGLLPAFLTDFYQLIMWKNEGITSANSKVNYAYRTDLYNRAPELFEGAVTANKLTDYTMSYGGVWRFSQCYKQGSGQDNPLYLEPLYFRNFYYLEPKTILESTSNLGEFGYALIEAKDVANHNEESAKYLVILLNNEMKYFQLDYTKNWLTILDYTNADGQSGKLSLIDTNKIKQVNKITIFAGCDVIFTVFDQSQDPQAMAGAKYDDMIGYGFKTLNWNTQEQTLFSFENSNSGRNLDYTATVLGETIESSYHLSVAETYPVIISFGKLTYTLDAMLDSEPAGSISVTYYAGNKTFDNMQFVRNELYMQVGERIIVTYCAEMGYEFRNNAFELLLINNNRITLCDYETLKKDDGTVERRYVLDLTGAWLRENFYCANSKPSKYSEFDLSYVDKELPIEKDESYNSANPNNRTNYFGIIQVNTQQIRFKTSVKVYDSSKTGEDAWLEEIPLSSNWQLGNTINLSRAFNSKMDFENDNGPAFIYTHNGVRYAFVCSYAYCYANYANKSYLYTSYSFPLYDAELVNKEYEDLTANLRYFLNVPADNIVPLNARTISMVVEVREIVQIEVKVEVVEHDTETTNRTITISNSEQNSKQLTITPSSLKRNGYYADTVHIYSYNGLTENTIKADYDYLRYSGVEFVLMGETEQKIGSKFEVKTDSTIVVRFIPKLLNINVSYYLEGQSTTRENLKDILLDFNIMANGTLFADRVELYEGNEISIIYNLNSDYLITILINGKDQTITNGRVNYTVQDGDYDYGAIRIQVQIEEKPSSTITVKYQLADNRYASNEDDFGEIIVYVGAEQAEGSSNVKVLTDRRVSIQLNINSGYQYTGEVGFYGKKTNMPISAGRIELISSFTVNEKNGVYTYPYAGVYIVYLTKIPVVVELQLDDSVKGQYTIDSNSRFTTKQEKGRTTQISNAYVGVTISFSVVEEAVDEQFARFYYYDKDNQKQYENIVADKLNINTNLIDECCLTSPYKIVCGVEVLPKYMVNIEITSDYEGLEELVVNESKLTNELNKDKHIGDYLVSGNYYVTGTTAKLLFYAIQIDKYDVTLTKNGSPVGSVGEDGKTSYDLTITEQTLIVVKIAPKKFNIEVEEYHLFHLEDLENEELQPVSAENQINGLTTSSENDTLYNNQALIQIELNPNNSNGEWTLTKLEITTIEGITIRIEIGNNQLKVYANDVELSGTNDEYAVNGGEQSFIYTIRMNEGKLEIGYLTQQDVHINAYYTSLKTIEPSK